MKTFIIDVSRVSYSDKTYRINAENMQEATDKALELAYNEVFNEKSSEYIIDYAEELGETTDEDYQSGLLYGVDNKQ